MARPRPRELAFTPTSAGRLYDNLWFILMIHTYYKIYFSLGRIPPVML